MKWFQANISLARPFNPLPLWQALGPEVDGWNPRCWFFMRKAPALRLRFCGRGLERKVTAFLDRMVAEEAITGWRRGAYQPEVHLFGGREGMDVAHRHFTTDARTAIELELRGADLPLWSAALLHDLFCRSTGDRWEEWDVWKNLERLRFPVASVDDAAIEAMTRLVAGNEPIDGELAEAYRTSNQEVADRLLELADGGQLNTGIRALLPFYAAFHWNRFRLHVPQQASMIAAMQHVLNPRADMIGDRPRR